MTQDRLTPHFQLSEFRCPCCANVRTEAARELAQRLEPVREEYGPIFIWSGFRCQAQNQRVDGALFSQHLLGLAADIACTSDLNRFELVKLLLKHGFRRLGIAAKYVHADIGTTELDIIWTYY